MFDWDDFPVILGQGSLHDLRGAESRDPRNERLIGFKSVSYDAAVALNKRAAKPTHRRMGFNRQRFKN